MLDLDDLQFEKIKKYFFINSGISLNKKHMTMIKTRLLKLCANHNITVNQLLTNIEQPSNSQLMQSFVNSLTTNKTHFFRENIHFEELKKYIRNNYKNFQLKPMFIWCGAASTGQEVYSLLMSIYSLIIFENLDFKFKLLASDIDTDVLNQTKNGIYDELQMKNIPEKLIQTFFDKGNGANEGLFKFKSKFKVNLKIRKINIAEPKLNFPIKFDVVFIRNILIYFDKKTTNNFIVNLKNNLNENALLCFGLSEGLPNNLTGFQYTNASVYRYANSDRHSDISSSSSPDLIAIGASTGGPQAIEKVLSNFPIDCPPILVVQHIPKLYDESLAKRLDNILPLRVIIAKHGDPLKNGNVYIAPSNYQMKAKQIKNKFYIHLNQIDHITGHKPSVDYLFENLALITNLKICAALLTGMGKDGAKGLLELKNNGQFTIAQNEKSSTVFGMPRAAIELHAAHEVLSLVEIGKKLLNFPKLKIKNKHKYIS